MHHAPSMQAAVTALVCMVKVYPETVSTEPAGRGLKTYRIRAVWKVQNSGVFEPLLEGVQLHRG